MTGFCKHGTETSDSIEGKKLKVELTIPFCRKISTMELLSNIRHLDMLHEPLFMCRKVKTW
jgi:hypothetical protein